MVDPEAVVDRVVLGVLFAQEAAENVDFGQIRVHCGALSETGIGTALLACIFADLNNLSLGNVVNVKVAVFLWREKKKKCKYTSVQTSQTNCVCLYEKMKITWPRYSL